MFEIIELFAKGLIHVAKAADNAYYDSKENEHDSIVLTSDEKLGNMNIDMLNCCYLTSKIVNYSTQRAELILMSDQIKGFLISDIIVRKKCIYIRFKHSIPYNTGYNDFGSSMSINYIEANENVIVYGLTTYNSNEKEAFEKIANEIITELSR